MSINLTRRQFLKGSLAATGMTIAVSVTPFGYRLLSAAQAKQDTSFKPNVWFQITPDNMVTIWVPNSEMGQGVHTALPMIVADELEADWKQIKILQSGAGKEYGNPALGGERKLQRPLYALTKGGCCRPSDVDSGCRQHMEGARE